MRLAYHWGHAGTPPPTTEDQEPGTASRTGSCYFLWEFLRSHPKWLGSSKVSSTKQGAGLGLFWSMCTVGPQHAWTDSTDDRPHLGHPGFPAGVSTSSELFSAALLRCPHSKWLRFPLVLIGGVRWGSPWFSMAIFIPSCY